MNDKSNPIELSDVEVWQNDVGVWHGRYRLPNGLREEVPFNAADSGAEARALFAEFLSIPPERVKIATGG